MEMLLNGNITACLFMQLKVVLISK